VRGERRGERGEPEPRESFYDELKGEGRSARGRFLGGKARE